MRSPGLVARAARALLGLFRWRVEMVSPPAPKALIVVYPHTSNWDFVVGILARFALELKLSWMGKDTLFRWPFGALFRSLGGIPVNRRAAHGLTAQMEGEFAQRPALLLAIAPEGTRGYTDHWKSGFYAIARAADLPVGLGYIDYRARVVGIGEWITLSGDQDADLARLRAFYTGKSGLHPQLAGEIRFRKHS